MMSSQAELTPELEYMRPESPFRLQNTVLPRRCRV